MDVLAAVAAATRDRGLYGVACSGGADSLALADAAIRSAGAPHVVVVTIDHAMQPGSDLVAQRVAAWARGQGAAAMVISVDGGASEASARAARYAALAEACDRLGLSAMLMGHTARDQAETVLMRIVRGTGPAGLVGIPARRGPFVRPLLRLDRAAIDAYVADRELMPWSDPMNDDPAFTRVRMRSQILPLLRAENPRLDAALIKLADAAREWRDAIDELAAPFAKLPIDCAALKRLPKAIRKRALSLAVPGADLEQLDAFVCAPTQGTKALHTAIGVLVRTYDTLAPDPGIGNREGECEFGTARDVGIPHSPSASSFPIPGSAERVWRPGDRMRPARLKGRSRKLSDLFTDAKVPRNLRATARIREIDGEIVWCEYIGDAWRGS